MPPGPLALVLALAPIAAFAAAPAGVPEGHAPIEAPSFEGAIKPVLERRCTGCHGEKKKGGLDLRTVAAALRGGDEGPAVVFGDVAASPLWRRIEANEMPPRDAPPLTPTERALLRAWVKTGASGATVQPRDTVAEKDRDFWSFKPPVRPPVPAVRDRGRVRTPIDAFLLASLEAKGLGYGAEADRRALIRRVTLDLTGLPPTPEEIAAYERDPGPPDDAWGRLVDRLLASPHYGERWGRHWLDVAGYAESALYLGDRPRPGLWRYRDYVIRAFNADKPFDQFVREQLAGDELVAWRALETLPPEVEEKLAATGFLRNAPDGTDNQPIVQKDKRYIALQGAVEVSMKALMGLTLNCVRCHSHKFDPIPHEDYYKLVAIFQPAYDPENWLASNYYPNTKGRLRRVVNATLDQRQAYEERLKGISTQLAALQKRRREMKADATAELAAIEKDMAEMTRAMEETELPWIWALWDASTKPSPTYVLKRGDFESPGRAVGPGVLAVLDRPENPFALPAEPPAPETTGRRLALARWMTSPRHPLLARVFVNRVWQHHFGRGLVATPDDFGARGARPTHPELLDWLAVDFVERGWGVKALHRQILMSSAYRQSSRFDAARARRDPANRLLWRMPPRRLEAEAIRDTMLAVSGDLDRTLYGRSVRIARTEDKQYGPRADDPERNRRSVYLMSRRTEMPTFLAAFDAPAMETNAPVRSSSVIPQQALALMNSAFVQERSRRFAARVLREGGSDPVGRASWLAYGRPPRADERARVRAFVGARPARADAPSDHWIDLCHALLSANELIHVD